MLHAAFAALRCTLHEMLHEPTRRAVDTSTHSTRRRASAARDRVTLTLVYVTRSQARASLATTRHSGRPFGGVNVTCCTRRRVARFNDETGVGVECGARWRRGPEIAIPRITFPSPTQISRSDSNHVTLTPYVTFARAARRTVIPSDGRKVEGWMFPLGNNVAPYHRLTVRRSRVGA